MTVTITTGLPFPPGHPFHGGSQIVFVQKHQELLPQCLQDWNSLFSTSASNTSIFSFPHTLHIKLTFEPLFFIFTPYLNRV